MKQKNLLTLFLLLINLISYAQVLSVMDLYSVKTSSDIDVIHNFLVNNKNFKLFKSYNEKDNKRGWDNLDVYIFTNKSNIIKIDIASKLYEGEIKTFTILEYKIYTKDEYDNFVKSLKKFSFEMYKDSQSKENKNIAIYSQINSMKMIAIKDMGDFYQVELL